MTFKALLLEDVDGNVIPRITYLKKENLPEGDVCVAIEYSSLNYKDGLILANKANIVRQFPHVPGIDFAGVVTESAHSAFACGDRVVLNGWGVGERHWGGMSQVARVKADWLVKLPEEISTKRAMALGTAGYTAMLCVMALEEHNLDKSMPVLVTGAAGGVGSVAIAILAQLGYAVTAVTGRADQIDYLRSLGARDIVDRSLFAEGPAKPLGPTKWGAAVDTVGSKVLASVLAQMAYGAPVAICGNASGIDLPTSVLPFILRGVNLLGIDSVMCPSARRAEAWRRLAQDMPLDKLDAMTSVIDLDGVMSMATEILRGNVRGRTVINTGSQM